MEIQNTIDESKIIGEVQQQYNDTCAIKSQQIILNQFGVEVNEDQCVAFSKENGWYNGNGTQIVDIGRLLDASGIPCTQRPNSNVFDIVDQLQQGHPVIVAVDSGELEGGGGFWEWLEEFFTGKVPDHALIVSSIDASDPMNPQVIVTDPGTGEYSRSYPLTQFMDAWSDSNCFMVSTDVAPMDIVEQYQANDWDDMQMPEINNVSNETFHDFQNYSHVVDFNTQMPQVMDCFNMVSSNPGWDINQAISRMPMPAPIMPDMSFDMPMMSPAPMPLPLPPFDPMMFTPPAPAILPCNFNYMAPMDMSWMSQPYVPMNFPPVPHMPMMPMAPGFDPFMSQPVSFPSPTVSSVPTTEVEETDNYEEYEEDLSESTDYDNIQVDFDNLENQLANTTLPEESHGFEVDMDDDA